MKKISKEKKIFILFEVVGILGMFLTVIFMGNTFSSSKNAIGMLKTVAIYFIPFIISFMFVSTGLKGIRRK